MRVSWWPGAAALVCLAAAAACLENNAQSEPKQVCLTVPTGEFVSQMAAKPGKVIDVRTPQEYQDGHLENAENMNFYDKDFSDRLLALPKDQPYFIYCRSGGRSGKTLAMMQEAGFAMVFDLEGGFLRWEKEGRPFTSETEEEQP